jgi:hypothetical protein
MDLVVSIFGKRFSPPRGSYALWSMGVSTKEGKRECPIVQNIAKRDMVLQQLTSLRSMT